MTTLPQNIPFNISTSNPVTSLLSVDDVVVGQLGQSLDGCIATPTGDSKYINSDCGLKHLHAVRSVVDAVVVGVGSVNADDPKLTVRLCEGEHPTRVIIDPRGRVDMEAGLFRDNGADVVVVTSQRTDHPAEGVADVIKLEADGFSIEPDAIVSALRAHGLNKILIEGGNNTLSRFMDAGALDRLHLIVAPVIMGGGLSGLNLSPIDKLDEALRPEVTLYPLGRDILFDCNLQAKNTT
ncbi:MAG: RibD family protein [Pseudomonadota bacterium]